MTRFLKRIDVRLARREDLQQIQHLAYQSFLKNITLVEQKSNLKVHELVNLAPDFIWESTSYLQDLGHNSSESPLALVATLSKTVSDRQWPISRRRDCKPAQFNSYMEPSFLGICGKDLLNFPDSLSVSPSELVNEISENRRLSICQTWMPEAFVDVDIQTDIEDEIRQERMVGTMILLPHRAKHARCSHGLEIRMLAVSTYGFGIASALVKMAKRLIEMIKPTHPSLTVFVEKDNKKTILVYTRNGFKRNRPEDFFDIEYQRCMKAYTYVHIIKYERPAEQGTVQTEGTFQGLLESSDSSG